MSAELQRIYAGVWRVMANGKRIGTVSGAKALGGYDFNTHTGAHSVSPRRYPTAQQAAQALVELAGGQE